MCALPVHAWLPAAERRQGIIRFSSCWRMVAALASAVFVHLMLGLLMCVVHSREMSGSVQAESFCHNHTQPGRLSVRHAGCKCLQYPGCSSGVASSPVRAVGWAQGHRWPMHSVLNIRRLPAAHLCCLRPDHAVCSVLLACTVPGMRQGCTPSQSISLVSVWNCAQFIHKIR